MDLNNMLKMQAFTKLCKNGSVTTEMAVKLKREHLKIDLISGSVDDKKKALDALLRSTAQFKIDHSAYKLVPRT